MSQLNREWRIIWLLRISTFCIRIIDKAYGVTCQIYGSILHPILRISHYRERWPIISTHVSHVDSRLSDECEKTCSTQYVKGTTNSGSRPTYFFTIFWSGKNYVSNIPISSVATKDLSFQRQSKNITRYTENTLHRRKIKMVNARLLVQQSTHLVHPNSSFRLSYLLRRFLWKKREIDNT